MALADTVSTMLEAISLRRIVLALGGSTLFAAHSLAADSSALDRCLERQDLPRVARVRASDGNARYARVVSAADGIPTRVAPIGTATADLAEVLERASHPLPESSEVWSIEPGQAASRICAPVALAQAEIDAEQRVVVAAGLNYAAHAEEAGGGDVFLFPKPVEPTAPYGAVSAPAGVTLLDYEVELGFVLLGEVSLDALPSESELIARSAFFVANDITDREPIIVHAAISGPGTGFVEAKGQPGFLPAGPWLVRGTELYRGLAACGAEGLGLRLAVDEGAGFQTRQNATTARMLLDLRGLLEKVSEQVHDGGLRTEMPVARGGEIRHYPFAVGEERPRLPAGSVVLTGTPEGVALATPDPLGLLGRGLLRLRGPFEQFRREQLARAAAGEPGGYLAPGDRVRAEIDGLGAQIVSIAEPGGSPRDPCARSGIAVSSDRR
jgi:2-keto-4-pentenoate hydratase/2-oxohepta-3-ene-1,7-dioic acid hydratase in catechol pathway